MNNNQINTLLAHNPKLLFSSILVGIGAITGSVIAYNDTTKLNSAEAKKFKSYLNIIRGALMCAILSAILFYLIELAILPFSINVEAKIYTAAFAWFCLFVSFMIALIYIFRIHSLSTKINPNKTNILIGTVVITTLLVLLIGVDTFIITSNVAGP